MSNLKMVRIQAKIDELFKELVDLSDVKNPDEKVNKFYSRSLAALAIVMQCGVEYDIAAQSITDGYHDLGIDAVYNDTAQKKLILVQSKWRKDGLGSISQEEASTFAEGVARVINFDLTGCNAKLSAKQSEITDALRDMNYQIEIVYCHTGNQGMNEYASRALNSLLNQVNEDDSTELLTFTEIKLQDIYEYLANGQINESIVLMMC